MKTNILYTSIQYLKGIGSQRAQAFAEGFSIRNYKDLLEFYPSRYIDRTRYYKIHELQADLAEVQLVGKIKSVKTSGKGRAKRLVASFTDGEAMMDLVWFQGVNYIQKQLKKNETILIFGKVSNYAGQWQMMHPQMEEWSENKVQKSGLQAIYPSTDKLRQQGLTSRKMSTALYQILEASHQELKESLAQNILDEQGFISRKAAFYHIHFPKSLAHLEAAKKRLIFDEFYFQQLAYLIKNKALKTRNKSYDLSKVGDYFNAFYKTLPFQLTAAQKRVLKEIHKDLGSGSQMNRLVQGDVGSGKTIVALLAMLMAIDNGFQATLMAPTSILAHQHFEGISELLADTDIKVALLTGASKTQARREIDEQLQSGEIHILIGTHALLEDRVVYKNLGIAIIDEQHRFGVAQRAKMWLKNKKPPHILIMTATPIPRTLALSSYGELDLSIIDELPPGRKPIETLHFKANQRLRAIHFIRNEIEKGRQIYIVYPLIEESEQLDLSNLQEGYEAIIRDFPPPKYRVAIVHGRMKSHEKDEQMKRFSEGKADIMVATTVIEVGVNVPNASVMLIENAERFGLAQLHQLRGRVGRGSEQSYCLLMTSFKLGRDSKFRMKTMVESQDGFVISEADLQLRGPGDVLGTRQSGMMEFKIASLVQNREELELARQKAIETLSKDPNLSLAEHQQTRHYLALHYKKLTGWSHIS
ncbi:MAG: ATP-dependent DNA helicase RecG [Flavobacteriales bacterium]